MNSFEKKPSSVDHVTLCSGPLRLTLAPAVGGSIAAFDWIVDGGERSIMRQSPPELGRSLDACCFPLVPYVNRIRGGTFTFRDREIRLEPNMPGDPSPLHGQGWLNGWTVEQAEGRHSTLLYKHDAGEWPWTYEARQEFALDDHGLTVTLTCRNLDAAPMPCGLGQHPYFPCGATTRIDTQVDVAWTVDAQVLPVERVPAKDRYDLRNRLVCGQDLDNGFGGWGGTAKLTDPEWPFEVTISSGDARFFQLYSPPAGGIFVAEPVTHANAALNEPEDQWPDLGLKVLQQGEEMSLTMRVDVTPR